MDWEPGEPVAGEPAADTFLRDACLTYTPADAPARRAAAVAALAADPRLAGTSAHTAAACARPDLVQGLAEPDAPGGPYGWPPLMYLAYSRVPGADPVGTATALLDAGADPNAGCLWFGLESPFTVLTGVLGEGEQGPVAQPRHPDWMALAELLLARGADPNDSQGLYNRMFAADDAHLRLLLAHGLGRGDGGPWRARPAELVADQLLWAVEHDLADRVRLLLTGTGTRPSAELAATAARAGHTRTAAVLAELGAPEAGLDPVAAFAGAVLRGDPAVRDTPPEILAAARESHAWLLVWATARGNLAAVALLLELGFPVNARGRGDRPQPSTWETALHQAAHDGHGGLVELLLAHGADRALTDERFSATPAEWADHGGHPALAARLR